MAKLLTADQTLGYRWRDKVTGFEGVCISYNIHLTGCNQVTLDAGIKSKKKKGGAAELSPAYAFDVTRIERMPGDRIVIDYASEEEAESKTMQAHAGFAEARPGGDPRATSAQRR